MLIQRDWNAHALAWGSSRLFCSYGIMGHVGRLRIVVVVGPAHPAGFLSCICGSSITSLEVGIKFIGRLWTRLHSTFGSVSYTCMLLLPP